MATAAVAENDCNEKTISKNCFHFAQYEIYTDIKI